MRQAGGCRNHTPPAQVSSAQGPILRVCDRETTHSSSKSEEDSGKPEGRHPLSTSPSLWATGPTWEHAFGRVPARQSWAWREKCRAGPSQPLQPRVLLCDGDTTWTDEIVGATREAALHRPLRKPREGCWPVGQPDRLCPHVSLPCTRVPPEKMAGHNAAKSLSLPYPSGPELSPSPPLEKKGQVPCLPCHVSRLEAGWSQTTSQDRPS